jgi:hypothetical protein
VQPEKLRFKASSTFWSAQGYPSEDDTIQLDMRRMDRILDIDARNLFAVVEPGVIGATLQAETMKVGLNTHIPGVGCSSSILASATSYYGSGASNLYGGHHFDNLMAVEWVMPTGDLLRTVWGRPRLVQRRGSGPSMRASPRLLGQGRDGRLHEVLVKLFPWPDRGRSGSRARSRLPHASLGQLQPTRSRSLVAAWADAAPIWDTGIGYIAHRQFNMFGRDLKVAMVRILPIRRQDAEDLEPSSRTPRSSG